MLRYHKEYKKVEGEPKVGAITRDEWMGKIEVSVLFTFEEKARVRDRVKQRTVEGKTKNRLI